jgi:hypothetical protein
VRYKWVYKWYANNEQPPFLVTFSCWDHTYYEPSGCEGGYGVKCPPGGNITVPSLEIMGQHFNPGNVEWRVLSGEVIQQSGTVAAVAGNPGKLAGSFDVKTNVECPGPHKGVGINLIDSCTGTVIQRSFLPNNSVQRRTRRA